MLALGRERMTATARADSLEQRSIWGGKSGLAAGLARFSLNDLLETLSVHRAELY